MRLEQMTMMTLLAPMQDVEESTLTLGKNLGEGKQGVVYTLQDMAEPLVFKKYMEMPQTPNPTALKALISLPGTLPTALRAHLLSDAAWPLHRVLDSGRLTGFLMREVPEDFKGTSAAERIRFRDLQYLTHPYRPSAGTLVPAGGPTTQTRLGVARKFAALVALLHGGGLSIGDISILNLLWADPDGEHPSILMLDCDGIRFHGMPPVTEQLNSPDWVDPHESANGLDLETDRYKLALVIGRVLGCAKDAHPAEGPLSFPADLPAQVANRVATLWSQAAGPYGHRPDATRWLRALTG
jgi:hypothetical protein